MCFVLSHKTIHSTTVIVFVRGFNGATNSDIRTFGTQLCRYLSRNEENVALISCDLADHCNIIADECNLPAVAISDPLFPNGVVTVSRVRKTCLIFGKQKKFKKIFWKNSSFATLWNPSSLDELYLGKITTAFRNVNVLYEREQLALVVIRSVKGNDFRKNKTWKM